ncbi:uncharacterized protein LOC126668993 [Mercurialis annua]|uniref:uncharacterized protein LOC126668993 n=1 Tax=Mercurialis annua TaxID=3986 RepID=UPI002160A576|nr:uncharacterized protein LOC126668993 [Mercurialis annua]
MFGISYGELFLLVGATAALIGPKDLPIISRTAGRLAGRAIGYVQLARSQFDNVMQQSQASQVHKELKDAMAQLEAIRYEMRSISMLNANPLSRRLVDNIDQTPSSNVGDVRESLETENTPNSTVYKPHIEPTNGGSIPTTTKVSKTSESCNMHSQATAYARLAELSTLKIGSLQSDMDAGKLTDDVDLLNVLPLSAESTGILPNRPDDVKGSDILLEAIVEAEVAQKAKEFFTQPENQIKYE